jgi:hypothetical protein
MRYREIPSPSLLADAIECYWLLQSNGSAANRKILGIPMQELSGRMVPLEVLQRDLVEAVRSAGGAGEMRARLRIIEAALLKCAVRGGYHASGGSAAARGKTKGTLGEIPRASPVFLAEGPSRRGERRWA